MTIARVVDAVLIAGEDRRLLAAVVAQAQHARQRNGAPPSRHLADLLQALAPAGQSDSPERAAAQDEPVELITIDTAAELLACSPRTARRLAPRLGGRLVGGRWLVDRLAVTEHAEGQQ